MALDQSFVLPMAHGLLWWWRWISVLFGHAGAGAGSGAGAGQPLLGACRCWRWCWISSLCRAGAGCGAGVGAGAGSARFGGMLGQVFVWALLAQVLVLALRPRFLGMCWRRCCVWGLCPCIVSLPCDDVDDIVVPGAHARDEIMPCQG